MVRNINKILLTSLVSAIVLNSAIISQTLQQAQTFSLNIPVEQNSIYEAGLSVRLEPGFSFKGANGISFDGRINTAVNSTLDAGNGDISKGLTTGYVASTAPSGVTAPPGTLPGSVDVSPMGAATYSIPIDLPKGLGDIAPQLAITYNSQAGDGLLGKGWNLAGISSITRGPQTMYYDNNVRAVDFSNNDRFYIDGQRLVVTSSTNGANGSTYSKEAQDFSTVTCTASTTTGPDNFSVTTKDGTTILYGTIGAIVTVPGSKGLTIMTWLVKKITDRRGNYIMFYYDNLEGQVKLTEIDYTGNTNANFSPTCSVIFGYGILTNSQNYYIGGTLFSSNLYLNSITSNDTRAYTFSYNTDNNRLLSISLSKGGQLLCNPTKISWGTIPIILQRKLVLVPILAH
jgi:hypothetical protein